MIFSANISEYITKKLRNKNTYPPTGKQFQSVSAIHNSHSQGVLIYKG